MFRLDQMNILLLLIATCVYQNMCFAFTSPPGSNSKLISRIQMSDDTISNIDKEIIQEPPQSVVKCPDCDKCDGSGRILGGIPTILPWWPIKPYRPCPNFIARGGKYSRVGQPLDEIAFGRGNIDAENDDF